MRFFRNNENSQYQGQSKVDMFGWPYTPSRSTAHSSSPGRPAALTAAIPLFFSNDDRRNGRASGGALSLDIMVILELVVFIVLLGFSGFFSSTEVALFSLNQMQLEELRRNKHPRFPLIEKLLSEPRRLIVTILIGNEFVNVSASTLSAAMIIHFWGAESELINLFIMVPILLLFGEITPKVLAIRNNVAFALVESRLIAIFASLIRPLRWVVRIVADFFITLIVGKERSKGNLVTEDMVRTLAREAVGEGTLDHKEAELIDQVFEFGDKTLEDIMTRRSDIHFLAIEMTPRDLIAEIKRTQHSRYPVYKGHRDTIVGVLHTRDLLGADLAKLERDPQGLRKLLREAHFFPESKAAAELFHVFRQRKLSFALTVDEYGGVTGLVTMEDLLECLFGEIHSPSDVAQQALVTDLGDGRFLVDAAISVEELNAWLESRFPTDQVETLAGLLLDGFGELPDEGASLVMGSWQFVVRQLVNNRITQVLIEPAPAAPPAEVQEGEGAPIGDQERLEAEAPLQTPATAEIQSDSGSSPSVTQEPELAPAQAATEATTSSLAKREEA